MIKLIVSDLDGTLLNEQKRVRVSDKELLSAAARAGIEICLASGRMHKELTDVMKELQIPCHRISQNGAFVYTKEEELLRSSTFSPELAKEILELARPYDVVNFICVDQTIFVPEKTPAALAIEARMFESLIELPSIYGDIGEDLVPCKLTFFGNSSLLKQLQAQIQALFSGQVETFISDVDCLDVMPAGISKGTGLQVLMEKLGLQADEVACIGDSYNDLSMFERVPHSFVMNHSDPLLQKKAKHKVYTVGEAVDSILQFNRQVGIC